MRRTLITAGLCGLIVLAGCVPAAPITKQELASANYGAPMTQAQITASARQFFDGYLKDPYSAVYHWQPAQKGIITTSILEGRKHLAGYILDGVVNAKNSYGGYTGDEHFQLLVRDGTVIHASKEDPETGAMVTL